MPDEVSGCGLTIAAVAGRARALFEGHEVADSERALWLTEPGRPSVCYFPAEDVQMSVLRRNDHVTTSPWLGVASWYTILRDARIVEDVAWSYDRPYDEAGAVAGHLAFDPDQVDFQVDQPPPPRHVPAHDPPYV